MILISLSNLWCHINKSYSLIHGHVYSKLRVMQSGLWGVSSHVYTEERYPDYCSGNNYVISSGVAQRIVTCHEKQDGPIIHLEDVYIAGLLSICAETKLKHEVRFPNYGRMYPIYKMMNTCGNCGRYNLLWRKFVCNQVNVQLLVCVWICLSGLL